MSGFGFINLLREVHRRDVVDRVLDALRLAPATVRGLVNELQLPAPLIGIAISLLRKNEYAIECRGWKHGGPNRLGIKGTYHLVSEPEPYPGSMERDRA